MLRDHREEALKLLRPSERALMNRQITGFLRLARIFQKDVLKAKRDYEAAGPGSHFHDHYLYARSNRYWNLAAAHSVKDDFAWYAREEEKARRVRKHQRELASIKKRYGMAESRRAA